jgi:hypothetical protein
LVDWAKLTVVEASIDNQYISGEPKFTSGGFILTDGKKENGPKS